MQRSLLYGPQPDYPADAPRTASYRQWHGANGPLSEAASARLPRHPAVAYLFLVRPHSRMTSKGRDALAYYLHALRQSP